LSFILSVKHYFYRENTQSRAEKSDYIFMSIEGYDILNPAMPA